MVHILCFVMGYLLWPVAHIKGNTHLNDNYVSTEEKSTSNTNILNIVAEKCLHT